MYNLHLRPIIALCIVFISIFTCSCVKADCTLWQGTSTVQQQFNIPTLRLKKDVAADTILWQSDVIAGATKANIYCYTEQQVTSGYQTPKTLVNGIATTFVYQTNNPGIGIKILTSQDRSNLIPMAWPKGNEQAHASYAYNQQNYFKVELIATGAQITSGTLDLSNFNAERMFGSARQYLISFVPTLVQVQSIGCDLQTKEINVPLTTARGVETTSLATSGATTYPVNFTVSLSCAQGTNISIKFDGTTLQGQPNTLVLDNVSTATSAQGVGVQILNNNQPVNFGQEIALLNNVSTTQINLPYQARLIRLDDDLKAGDVNATATFDMIYR